MHKASPSKTPPPADYLNLMRKVAEENLRLQEERQKLQEENEKIQSQLDELQTERQVLLSKLDNLYTKLQTSNASATSSFNQIAALLNIPGILERPSIASQTRDNPAIVQGKRSEHLPLNQSSESVMTKRRKLTINMAPNANGRDANHAENNQSSTTLSSFKPGPS